MELSDAGLQKQPFRATGEPLAVSAYAAHRKALDFLNATYTHRHGLGVLHGPTLSGKTTVIRQFIKSLGPDVSSAVVDSKDLDPDKLVRGVLEQFGYALNLDSTNEVLGMLRVVAMQQTVSGHSPVLVVEGCHHLEPPVLAMLCELADIKANRQSAIRLIMACERSVDVLMSAEELKGIASRVTGVHTLRPMALRETRDYLHSKLYAAGCSEPASIMPDNVCVDIHMGSGGWPGIADRLAAFALAKGETLPLTPDLVERRELPPEMREAVETLKPVDSATDLEAARPRLLVSWKGRLIDDIEIERARLLIGRTGHNDLTVDSKFVSRHHALLVSQGSSTLLMDLNSTNGTFVNSRRVSNHVMRHDDVISFGNHTIKFVHPAAERGIDIDDSALTETVIMKTLEDMRHMLSGESTQTMPIEVLNKMAAGDKD